MRLTQFRTHTGQPVTSEALKAALAKVSRWYVRNAFAIRREDAYASHVTEEVKVKRLREQLIFAHRVRHGYVGGFTIWQRVNQELTGECVALLAR